MTMSSQWQSRYSTQRQIHLTRPDAPGSTTADTTFLGFAALDIAAEMENVGIAYDETVAQHVACACAGVTAWLMDHGADPGGGWLQKWRDGELERTRMATSQNRIIPQSTSELTVSDEVGSGETVYPDFDRLRFAPLFPGPTPATNPASDPDRWP